MAESRQTQGPCAMQANQSEQFGAPSEKTPDTALPNAEVPTSVRVAATALRIAFIAVLLLVTWHVSMPQNETIWTAYDTPGDLVRIILGFAICVWLVIQLFWGPRDAQTYRTWLYLGLAAVPFAVICLVAIW